MGHCLATTVVALAVAGLAACGSDTNLMGLTVPGDHLESFDALLSQARAEYDANDLDSALKFGEMAYRLDPRSERASVLYGLINLSLAGGDPYRLAGAMAANNKKSAAEPAPGSLALSGDGTADTLSALKAVLGVTDAELELMASKDASDPELPVLVPKCVEDARSAAERLRYLNQAILAICPFVDPEARVASDYRQECEPTTGGRSEAHKAHFLWAFAHLTEALAFNAVLTYSTSSAESGKTNLELRVERLKAQDTSTPAGLASFLAAVDSVQSTLDSVLPVSGSCSDAAPTTQLRATLNDMLSVDAAFRRMPGVPEKIISGISKAVSKLKGIEAGASITEQTRTLKGDFTKKMSSSLAEKIDQIGADPGAPLSADQQEQLCATFASIATDVSGSTLCSAR